MENQNFLIVGCGSIGLRHLKNLRQLGIKNIGVYDTLADRVQNVQAEYAVQGYTDLNHALGVHPRAVLICTPTYLHARQALEAARAGCNLFVEKPLATAEEELPELLAEVKRQRLFTLVGCNFRFHPALRKVKQLLSLTTVGRVTSVRAQFGQYLPDWHPWEDYRQGYSASRALGGGVLLDRIHEFDTLRWLLGEFDQVSAFIGRLGTLEIDTEDNVEVLVHFVSGAFGSIHLDYIRRTYDCSLEIVGEGGIIRWSYPNASVEWYEAHDHTWKSLRWVGYDGNQMYLDEMRHFTKILTAEEPPESDAWDAARVLRVVLAARESARHGCVMSV